MITGLGDRELTRRAVLVGSTALLGMTTLGACGRSPDDSPGSTKPTRGGRLRAAFAGSGPQEVLDPHRTNFYADVARSKALYDKLVDFGDDLTPQPRLASDWTSNHDSTEWVVRLRKTNWHNGKPFRAADVLYTYSRILDPGSGLRPRSSMTMIDMAHTAALDDHTIRFALNRPYSEFPSALAAFGAYIIPEGTRAFSHPIGTGPFRFSSFTAGRSFLASRFEEYFDGAAFIDELEILIAPEEAARINALVSQQVDYADDLTPSSARTHERTPNVSIVRSPRSGISGFAMKTDRPPFDDIRLRQAMYALLDRSQLLSSVVNDFGELGNDLFGKGYQYYPESLPQREADIDTARELVKKTGAHGKTIVLDTTSATNGFLEAANLLREQADAAGLDIRVNNGDPATYWSRTVDEGVLSSFRSGAMPIESNIAQRFLSDSTKNYTQWKRPEFDALYREATTASDPAVRTQAYHRMQSQLFEEGGLLVWGVLDGLTGVSGRLQDLSRTAPTNTLDYARFDKAWLR